MVPYSLYRKYRGISFNIVSRKTIHKFRWLIISLVYVILCTISPLFYRETFVLKVFVHDFEVKGEFAWFLRDSLYVSSMFFYARIALIKDDFIRIQLARIFMGDAIREFLDLLIWNNQYSVFSFILQNLFLIGAIIFLYKKFKKLTPHVGRDKITA